MQLAGKTALISGGTQGIGLAIARRYIAEGARVVLVYRSNEQAAAEAVQSLNEKGQSAFAIKGDFSNVKGIDAVVKEAISEYDRIDILVNNAGVFRTVSVEDTTEEIWDEQLNLNLKGAFFATKALVPHFRKNGGGKVVNITSIAGMKGFPNCPAYCASKGGFENLTRALAVELGKENINVNAVAPGNVATNINSHLRTPEQAAYIQQMRDMTPTGRDFLEPDEIAGAAAFLASSSSSAMHGASILVDGGWCAW